MKDRFLYICIKYNSISFPPKFKEWVLENEPKDERTFQQQLDYLNKFKPFYFHWLTDYHHLPARHTQGWGDAKRILEFFEKSVRGKIENQTDLDYLSVLMKIALDHLLMIQYKHVRPNLDTNAIAKIYPAMAPTFGVSDL